MQPRRIVTFPSTFDMSLYPSPSVAPGNNDSLKLNTSSLTMDTTYRGREEGGGMKIVFQTTTATTITLLLTLGLQVLLLLILVLLQQLVSFNKLI